MLGWVLAFLAFKAAITGLFVARWALRRKRSAPFIRPEHFG